MPQNLSSNQYKFQDRKEATLKLIDALPVKNMREEEWMIVAISKNAAEMASLIAQKTSSFFEIMFIEEIYALNNPEYKIAMVSETEDIVVHKELVESFEISLDYIYGEAHRKFDEKILKDITAFRKVDETIGSKIEGKRILIVDDGCETGLTALTAVKSVINKKAKAVFLAVPILPIEVKKSLISVVDGIYYIYAIENFIELEYYYKNFDDAEEEYVKSLLKKERENQKNKLIEEL